MKYAFQTMRLEADSLLALATGWAEMQLIVTDERAVVRGYGFAHEIAQAFSALVLDWEATILLRDYPRDLVPGTYALILLGEDLYAARNQRKFRIPDAPVVVEVTAAPEDDPADAHHRSDR